MLFYITFATENDKSKFEYIYNTYKKLLLYKAYDILKDYSLAEDAASEAFLRIYKNLNKIEDSDSAATVSFLVTIVKNISITLLNKQKKISTVYFEEFEKEDNFDLEAVVISETVTDNMLKLVDKLKDELKSPFLLRYAHDLSHKEISKILNISENNVTVRIHRAKNKLVKLLKEEGYIYEI